ncbi:MAG: HEAT repeat domain-containing protein [Chthoniobacterales bacterium]
MKRIICIIAGIVVLIFVWPFFAVSEHYSGVCVRCLQRVSGVDKSFFAIPYYHREWLDSARVDLMSPAIFGSSLPTIGADTYGEIFGKACAHQIVRTGFCRYGGGVVGCGSYGGSQDYELRLALVQQLYVTFRRLPNRELGQQTYELIDRLYPFVPGEKRVDRPMHSPMEADFLPNEPLSILLRGLALANSEHDWRTVLEATRQGNGQLELLNSRDILTASLRNEDPGVRLQALKSLAASGKPEAWNAVASALDDRNDQVAEEAITEILYNRCFEQYDRVLAMQKPRGYTYQIDERHLKLPINDLAEDLTDQEIRTLLSRKQPRVDQLCFLAIMARDRFGFLHDLLEVLNDRPSPGAVEAVDRLLAGPYPDLARDQKTHLPIVHPGKLLGNRSDDYYNRPSSPSDSPTDVLMRRAAKLARTKGADTWDAWRDIFEQWMSEEAVESTSAAFADAMYSVSPSRTVDFLNARLATAGDGWGNEASHVLAAMGTIGDAAFLPAIEKFVIRSKGGSYETNAAYRIYVDFALHRCRQIPHWKLVESSDAGGKYSILRTDGTYLH